MSEVKITELPAATSGAGTDIHVIVQSGITKQITTAQGLTNATITNPTLTTPVLGTPTSGNLQNCTGYQVGNIASMGTGISTFLTTPSSNNLRAAVTDETGTGALVFATSPSLVTPALGTPATGTLTNCTGFPVANLANLGTGVSTFLTAPSSTNLIAAMTDETGSGLLVFGTAPTITDATLGGAIKLTVQSLSGAGAVNITDPTTAFTSTAAGNALTLADGAVGQIKTVVYVAEAAGADTGVLTPTTCVGYSTITFTNVGDSATLQFFTQGWAVVGFRGATVA